MGSQRVRHNQASHTDDYWINRSPVPGRTRNTGFLNALGLPSVSGPQFPFCKEKAWDPALSRSRCESAKSRLKPTAPGFSPEPEAATIRGSSISTPISQTGRRWGTSLFPG